jgi:hypothetical protein
MGMDGAILNRWYLRTLDYAVFPEDTHLQQSLTAETKSALDLREVPFADLRGLGYRRAWLVSIEHPVTSAVEISERQRIMGRYFVAPIHETSTPTTTATLHLVFLW